MAVDWHASAIELKIYPCYNSNAYSFRFFSAPSLWCFFCTRQSADIQKMMICTYSYAYLKRMLGCEIDFIVKGLDSKTRSIAASRKDAMMKKRQIFFLNKDSSDTAKVHEDRVVQARIIAVSEKVVRVEVFGVETSIPARDLSFDWLGDANERFHVGEQILVRILDVKAEDVDHITIRADVKSVEGDTSKANMKLCKVQGKYAGTVEDIHKGTVFVRLAIGVNAIAHSCMDNRSVGKKDVVFRNFVYVNSLK